MILQTYLSWHPYWNSVIVSTITDQVVVYLFCLVNNSMKQKLWKQIDQNSLAFLRKIAADLDWAILNVKSLIRFANVEMKFILIFWRIA